MGYLCDDAATSALAGVLYLYGHKSRAPFGSDHFLATPIGSAPGHFVSAGTLPNRWRDCVPCSNSMPLAVGLLSFHGHIDCVAAFKDLPDVPLHDDYPVVLGLLFACGATRAIGWPACTWLVAFYLILIIAVCLVRLVHGLNMICSMYPGRSNNLPTLVSRKLPLRRRAPLSFGRPLFPLCQSAWLWWMCLVGGGPRFVSAQSCSVGTVYNTGSAQCVTCPGGVFCLGGANPAISCPAGT